MPLTCQKLAQRKKEQFDCSKQIKNRKKKIESSFEDQRVIPCRSLTGWSLALTSRKHGCSL